jgi:hypothetical protein
MDCYPKKRETGSTSVLELEQSWHIGRRKKILLLQDTANGRIVFGKSGEDQTMQRRECEFYLTCNTTSFHAAMYPTDPPLNITSEQQACCANNQSREKSEAKTLWKSLMGKQQVLNLLKNLFISLICFHIGVLHTQSEENFHKPLYHHICTPTCTLVRGPNACYCCAWIISLLELLYMCIQAHAHHLSTTSPNYSFLSLLQFSFHLPIGSYPPISNMQ